MPLAQVYPTGQHEVAALIDLSDQTERARLSPDASRAFFNVMEHWGIRDKDARRLLGGMSNGAYYALKRGSDRPLDEDRLRRISYLIGIFKALNILHGEALADRWMQLPNRNRIFGGTAPLEYLMEGGMPAFATVRRLLDVRRGG